MNTEQRSEWVSFFARMRENREKGRFTDVIVICNDQVIFRCHQLILAATSDYFDAMLGTDVCQISHLNLPTTIPSHIFGLIVKYMYTGTVTFLNDANVYDLLIAGNILRMGTIEKACHHYLSQKGIPRLWFRKIFKFACSTDDPLLQSTVCQFALKKENDELLSEVTQSEFQVLVSHFKACSPAEEALMVEKILKWTLPSSISDTKSREQVGLNFMNSVKLFPFEHLPKDYAATYFEEMVTNDRPWRLHEGASLDVVGLNSINSVKLFAFEYLPLFHAEQYFENMIANEDCPVPLREGISWSVSDERSALVMFSKSERTPLKLCALAQKGDNWKWQSLSSRASWAVLSGMRCTEVDGRLYWLLSRAPIECDDRKIRIEFRLSASIDSFVRSTKLPSPFSIVPPVASVRMCSDENSKIFACASYSTALHMYDCELQRWSDFNLGNSFFPRAMTWYDRQLYILGGESPTSNINILERIDLRMRRHSQVWGSRNMYAARYECSSHKERLYVASFCEFPSGIMIFDPIAGKAIDVKMPQTTFDDEYRLASLQDTLYTISCDTNKRSISVNIFDPFSHTFENVPVDNVVDPESYLLDVAVFKQCLWDWSDRYPRG